MSKAAVLKYFGLRALWCLQTENFAYMGYIYHYLLY